MSTIVDRQQAHAGEPPASGAASYIVLTVVTALVAALAAFATLSLGLAPWIMFMGWVAYFTRPTPSQGVQSFACVVVGLILGAVATIAVGELADSLRAAALPVVVFAIGSVVIAARGLPVLNNLLAYFIGLITFFAAHPEPALIGIGELTLAVAVGFAAGLLSQRLQAMLVGAKARTPGSGAE